MRSSLAKLFLLSSLFLQHPEPAYAAPDPQRPNFVFIFADDQHYRDFGFYDPKVLTPSLDQLRAEGTLFNNFYVASTVCQPSRYALFTGRYPSRAASASFAYGERYTAFNTRVLDTFPSLAHGLRDSGYQTGFVGKVDGYIASDFQDDRFSGIPTNDQRILVNRMGTHGYTFASSLYKGNLSSKEHHNMEWVTQGALKFMDESVSANNPFCLVVCPSLLHDNPIPSLNRTTTGYADAAFGGTITGAELGATNAAHLRGGNTGTDYTRQGVLNRARAADSDAALLWLDDAVGALLQKTKDLGVEDNTYFMFVSDHGDGEGNKGDLYQGGVNMPFLIRYPGGQPGATCAATVSCVDIMPTLYELAGVPLPSGQVTDGISFAKVLEDPTRTSRDAAYCEIGFVRTIIAYPWKYMAFRLPEEATTLATNQGVNPYSSVPHDPSRGKSSIFSGHFGDDPPFKPWGTWFSASWNRHVDYFDKDQLYNLATDYGEQDNLANKPGYQAKLSEMKAMLADTLYDVPGSFHEFKFEVVIDGTSVNNKLSLQGDLNLSYAFDILSVAEESKLTLDTYSIITYTGKLTGEFSRKKGFQRKGYEVDYSVPGQVRLVRTDFSKWKQLRNLPANQTALNDDDSDGIPLLFEYAMDSLPDQPSPGDYVLYEINGAAGVSSEMQIIYKKLRPELTYAVQWSETLESSSWSGEGISEVALSRDLVKATLSTAGKPQAFLRLLISE